MTFSSRPTSSEIRPHFVDVEIHNSPKFRYRKILSKPLRIVEGSIVQMSCWVSQLMHIISVLSYPWYRFSSFLWHRAWLTMAILSCTWSSDLYQSSERKCRLEKSESLVDSQILFAESVDKDITLNKSRSSTKANGWAVLDKPALLLCLISLIESADGWNTRKRT